MTAQEIIEKIKAEIKIRLSANGAFDEEGDSAWHYDQGLNDAYNYILSFLSDLEKEEKPINPVCEGDRIKRELIVHLEQEVNSATLDVNRKKWKKMLDYVKGLNIQPVCDGLEDEIKSWHKRHFKSRNAWEDYSGHYLDKNSQLDLARHFAQWGAEHLKK